MDKPEPKISIIEAGVLLIVVILADLIELILGLFLLPDFWIPDIIAFPVTQIYLRMKGVRGEYALMGNLAELIPYVSALPMRTITIIMTIAVDRSPRLKEKLEMATKVVKPVTK